MEQPNTCEPTLSALGAYLDNELGIRKKQQVEAHLAQCEDCQAELMALRRLSDLLHESEPLPRIIPAERFAAQVILQLKPRAPTPSWKRRAALLWWIFPAIVLGGWVFLHTAFFVSGLAVAILKSGILSPWVADGLIDALALPPPHQTSLPDFFPQHLVGQTLITLILQLQTLFLTLMPQFLLVLLYWSWLVGWQILKRNRQNSTIISIRRI